MNLDSTPVKKTPVVPQDDFQIEDFDFKPITSGLGFHHQKPADVKPVFTDRVLPVTQTQPAPAKPKTEMNVYQNDLSLFYGQSSPILSPEPPVKEERTEKVYRLATKPQRVFAYITDLLFVLAIVSLVLTTMARSIGLDLLEAWMSYPHEITPLVVTLFTGFYLIYFAVFEKSSSSTLGKYLFGLKVVSLNDKSLGFTTLVLRSFITLLNFFTLGLFSYFDLQNKVTDSKIIRND